MSSAQYAVDEINTKNAYEEDNKNQYLTFILAGEEYGVDILQVQEIKGWDNVTKIPNAPLYIKGVMNLRGAIVPIIDLRQRFNLENLEYGLMTVVIVLKVTSDGRERTMGIVVDAVSDVYDIAKDDIKPPPDFGDSISIEFLKGLATVDKKMVMILDINHLLTKNEMEILNSASRRGAGGNSVGKAASQQADSATNIALLEKTFAALAPQGEQLTKCFYEKLFSRHPAVKPLFAHLNMKEQETKLLAALKLVVGNLRNPQLLTQTLEKLGKRHKDYGADAGLYEAVGNTLIDVLREASGTQWTDAANNAWTGALQNISGIMLRAANE